MNNMQDDSQQATVYAFGANNFGQVENDDAHAMYRSPIELTKLSTRNILAIAVGGDQSFAIGALLRVGAESPSNVQSLLTRKFSVLANKGLGQGPIDSTTFLKYLSESFSGNLLADVILI